MLTTARKALFSFHFKGNCNKKINKTALSICELPKMVIKKRGIIEVQSVLK